MLFQKVANYISGSNHINSFNPQNIFNIVWAFSKAEESNPSIFQKVAKHIIKLNNLNSFIWAFAKAKESNPRLFHKVAHQIIRLSHLNTFKPQELFNSFWAFAKAGEWSSSLFLRVADRIIELSDLNTYIQFAASYQYSVGICEGWRNPSLIIS
ncbi:hypothetical protein ACHAWF_000663 [Thalassiosira exigua]